MGQLIKLLIGGVFLAHCKLLLFLFPLLLLLRLLEEAEGVADFSFLLLEHTVIQLVSPSHQVFKLVHVVVLRSGFGDHALARGLCRGAGHEVRSWEER